MDVIKDYFIQNFILICLSLVMIIIAIQRFRQHSKISLCTIIVVGIALLLSISNRLQEVSRLAGHRYLTLTFGIIGYALRPCCVGLLILMSENFIPKKYRWAIFVPLVINLVIYLFSYLPGTEEIIFGYYISDVDGQLHFSGGPLRYASHIISALYLSFLLYISFTNLKAKHLEHGLAILICSIFVVLAVLVEMFDSSGDIQLLNLTIVASTMVYYLFLYMERTQIDTLTGLFNRETYYRDMQRMGERATGVIQFDMNGLKYINDNLGHLEGDKALSTIALIILKSTKRSMYAYRLGGDEFTVVVNNSSEEEIQKAITKFKENLAKTPYHCSIGYAHRQDKNIDFIDLLKEAEKKMYQDKEEFYKNANFERRKI